MCAAAQPTMRVRSTRARWTTCFDILIDRIRTYDRELNVIQKSKQKCCFFFVEKTARGCKSKNKLIRFWQAFSCEREFHWPHQIYDHDHSTLNRTSSSGSSYYYVKWLFLFSNEIWNRLNLSVQSISTFMNINFPMRALVFWSETIQMHVGCHCCRSGSSQCKMGHTKMRERPSATKVIIYLLFSNIIPVPVRARRSYACEFFFPEYNFIWIWERVNAGW